MNERAARTVRYIRVHRQIGTARRRRRLPRQLHPNAIARAYAQEIQRYVDLARQALQPLEQALPRLLASAARERRHDAGEGDEIRRLIEATRRDIVGSITTAEVERLARLFAERTANYQRSQLARQLQAGLGVDLFTPDTKIRALLDGFVHENVALIESVPAQVIAKIEGRVTRAVTSGQLYGDLAEGIQEEFAIGERRAVFIARDQIGSAYGQINASRQQDLGVESYYWRTSKDERVRPEHRALDGVEFRYGDPGGGDHGMIPGQPILCRCNAEGNFQALLDVI